MTSLNDELKINLEDFLKNWTKSYLREILGDLINLTTIHIENQYLRGFSFSTF